MKRGPVKKLEIHLKAKANKRRNIGEADLHCTTKEGLDSKCSLRTLKIMDVDLLRIKVIEKTSIS
jgi:hypothetical protein